METTAFIWLGSSVSLALCAMAMAGPEGRGSNSLDRLHRELDRLHAAHANVEPLAGGALPKLFPAYDCYAVTFRQFPVARIMPEPLKASNVFAVPHAEGKPLIINSIQGLRDFFRDKLPPVRAADRAREATQAWLEAATTLHQDGFYRFTIDGDSIQTRSVEGRIEATGRAIAMRGGNGSITATFTFDKEGKLYSGTDSADLHPGPRPICHATKLLDPDPIVRKIVEQDLLIMGPAAIPYLEEVQGAASPQLRSAIDKILDRISRENCPAGPWQARP
jgi:hypothetical protein